MTQNSGPTLDEEVWSPVTGFIPYKLSTLSKPPHLSESVVLSKMWALPYNCHEDQLRHVKVILKKCKALGKCKLSKQCKNFFSTILGYPGTSGAKFKTTLCYRNRWVMKGAGQTTSRRKAKCLACSENYNIVPGPFRRNHYGNYYLLHFPFLNVKFVCVI